jgi:hypothetical protein
MSMKDFSKDAAVVLARYKRHSNGYTSTATGIVADLPTSVANPILAKASLYPSESPLILSVTSDSDWTLITTCRLIAAHSGQLCRIQLSDIESVFVDFDACTRADEQYTLKFSHISVQTSSEQYAIRVQPGAGFLGITSVLHLFATKNARASI